MGKGYNAVGRMARLRRTGWQPVAFWREMGRVGRNGPGAIREWNVCRTGHGQAGPCLIL